ncbi:MAG: hypothetical protein WB561_10240 [Terracidiphilus sp.]
MAVTKKSLISNSGASKSTSKSTAKIAKPTSTAKLATAQRTLAKPLVAASAKTAFRVARGITLARQINAMRPL